MSRPTRTRCRSRSLRQSSTPDAYSSPPVFADYAGRLPFCQPVYRRGSDLSAVGAGRGAGLAMSLRALVGITAIHCRVLGIRIGIAARGEGQVPAAPAVVSDEGR